MNTQLAVGERSRSAFESHTRHRGRGGSGSKEAESWGERGSPVRNTGASPGSGREKSKWGEGERETSWCLRRSCPGDVTRVEQTCTTPAQCPETQGGVQSVCQTVLVLGVPAKKKTQSQSKHPTVVRVQVQPRATNPREGGGGTGSERSPICREERETRGERTTPPYVQVRFRVQSR